MKALHPRAASMLLPMLAVAACGSVVDASTAEAIQPSKEKPTMSEAPRASRRAPPRVLPVEHAGVRYMQDNQAFHHGGDQRGGYLVAVDMKTGERLWMLKVYPVADHRAAGVETPGIYFRSMKLSAGGEQLEIENEVGGIYLVDIKLRSSQWQSGPESARK
jgi:hypothetical protein